jgi:hypothetical protein
MRLFVVLVALGLAWSLPEVRVRTWDPVLERMGPVGEWVSGPFRRAGARSDADRLLRTLIADHQQGHALPEPRRFSQWAARRYSEGSMEFDPWGTPYFLERSGNRLTVGSAGPDRQRGTVDDIRATGSL